MKEVIENQGSNVLLTYSLEPSDQLDGTSLKALAYKKLQGFVPAAFSQISTTKFIRYNITGMTPISRVLEGQVDSLVIKNIFLGIAGAMQSILDNQVNGRVVLMDLDHIYVDDRTGQTSMLCLPVLTNLPEPTTVLDLCGRILKQSRLDNAAEGGFVRRIQSWLDTTPAFDPLEFKALVQAAAEAPKPVPVRPEPAKPVEIPRIREEDVSMFALLNRGVERNAPPAPPVREPETPRCRAYLLRLKTGERIELDKPVFRIGQEQGHADYCVSDNPAVSRSHAQIVCRNGEYFIVDTHSTNHTYINGVMIPSNVENRLPGNARVRLANEDFEFRLS